MPPTLKEKLQAELSFWEINQDWHRAILETTRRYTTEVTEMICTSHSKWAQAESVPSALEIGCGPLPSLRDAFFENVTYCDPLLTNQLRLAAEHLGLKSWVDYAEQYMHLEGQTTRFWCVEYPCEREEDGTWSDVIVCRNGLDHILDIDGALDVIRGSLCTDGILVIPHCHVFDYVDAKEPVGGRVNYRMAGNGEIDNAHPWSFSERGFQRMLDQHGFDFEGEQCENPEVGWSTYMKGVAYPRA